MNQLLTYGGNLQSWISFESDADACRRSGHSTPSSMVASVVDSTDIRDCKFLAAAINLVSASDSFCKFSIILHQHLIHLIPRMQVFLPHKGAPSFSGNAFCASPSPSWPCMMIKISKGDHFFQLWRYLYCLLVPGSSTSMKCMNV